MSKNTFPQATHDFHKSNGSDTRVFNREPSLTRQEFAEECDINALMARYDTHVIGGPGNLPPKVPMYFDWADTPQDLMGYLQFIQDAEASFMQLPAIVRKEFDNSAIEFVAFASDPANIDQMVSWGLADPVPKPPEASPVVVPSPSAPATPAPPAASQAAPTHGST